MYEGKMGEKLWVLLDETGMESYWDCGGGELAESLAVIRA